jgi:hypothetical protein
MNVSSYLRKVNLLQISRGCVENILKKFKNDKEVVDLPKVGRPRKLSAASQRYLVLTSKKNSKLTAKKLQVECQMQQTVSIDTVKRVLRRANLFGRIAVRKPYLSKINKQRRKTWCQERLSWNIADWSRIIFSDESKLELYPRRREYVRRTPGTPRMIAQTRKFSDDLGSYSAR